MADKPPRATRKNSKSKSPKVKYPVADTTSKFRGVAGNASIPDSRHNSLNVGDKFAIEQIKWDGAAPKLKEEEAAAAKLKEEEAAAAKLKEEEAAAAKLKEEEAAAAKLKEEEAAAAKLKEEEAAAAKLKEEEAAAAAKLKEEEAAAAKLKEEEAAAAKLKEEEDTAAKLKEEEAAAAAKLKEEEKEEAPKLEEEQKKEETPEEFAIAKKQFEADKTTVVKVWTEEIAEHNEEKSKQEEKAKKKAETAANFKAYLAKRTAKLQTTKEKENENQLTFEAYERMSDLFACTAFLLLSAAPNITDVLSFLEGQTPYNDSWNEISGFKDVYKMYSNLKANKEEQDIALLFCASLSLENIDYSHERKEFLCDLSPSTDKRIGEIIKVKQQYIPLVEFAIRSGVYLRRIRKDEIFASSSAFLDEMPASRLEKLESTYLKDNAKFVFYPTREPEEIKIEKGPKHVFQISASVPRTPAIERLSRYFAYKSFVLFSDQNDPGIESVEQMIEELKCTDDDWELWNVFNESLDYETITYPKESSFVLLNDKLWQTINSPELKCDSLSLQYALLAGFEFYELKEGKTISQESIYRSPWDIYTSLLAQYPKKQEKEKTGELEKDTLEEEKPNELEKDTLEEEKPNELEKDTLEEEKPNELEKDTIEEEKPNELEKDTIEEEKTDKFYKDTHEEEKTSDLSDELDFKVDLDREFPKARRWANIISRYMLMQHITNNEFEHFLQTGDVLDEWRDLPHFSDEYKRWEVFNLSKDDIELLKLFCAAMGENVPFPNLENVQLTSDIKSVRISPEILEMLQKNQDLLEDQRPAVEFFIVSGIAFKHLIDKKNISERIPNVFRTPYDFYVGALNLLRGPQPPFQQKFTLKDWKECEAWLDSMPDKDVASEIANGIGKPEELKKNLGRFVSGYFKRAKNSLYRAIDKKDGVFLQRIEDYRKSHPLKTTPIPTKTDNSQIDNDEFRKWVLDVPSNTDLSTRATLLGLPQPGTPRTLFTIGPIIPPEMQPAVEIALAQDRQILGYIGIEQMKQLLYSITSSEITPDEFNEVIQIKDKERRGQAFDALQPKFDIHKNDFTKLRKVVDLDQQLLKCMYRQPIQIAHENWLNREQRRGMFEQVRNFKSNVRRAHDPTSPKSRSSSSPPEPTSPPESKSLSPTHSLIPSSTTTTRRVMGIIIPPAPLDDFSPSPKKAPPPKTTAIPTYKGTVVTMSIDEIGDPVWALDVHVLSLKDQYALTTSSFKKRSLLDSVRALEITRSRYLTRIIEDLELLQTKTCQVMDADVTIAIDYGRNGWDGFFIYGNVHFSSFQQVARAINFFKTKKDSFSAIRSVAW